MKYFVLLFLPILFLTCNKNDCTLETCVFGTCENNICQCLEGYKGEQCDQQITPSFIYVETIYVRKFQPTTNNGTELWDTPQEGSNPDLFVSIEETQTNMLIFQASDIREEAELSDYIEFKVEPPVNLSKIGVDYTILLQDDDGGNESQVMERIVFTSYEEDNKFPDRLELALNGVEIDIDLSYEFQ